MKICVVYEDDADAEIACELADRVVREQITWIGDDPSLLEHQRTWCLKYQTRRLRWVEIDDIGRELNLRVRRNDQGVSNAPDYKTAVRALRVIKACFDDVAAVILMRDADKQSQRREGLEAARKRHAEQSNPFPVVIGLAKTKRECWVLSGFVAANENEQILLKSESRHLGFNPVLKSHQLTAQNDPETDKRSAKRVVRVLTKDNREREAECWQITELTVLRTNGQKNGLADYLTAVKDDLVPLFRP